MLKKSLLNKQRTHWGLSFPITPCRPGAHSSSPSSALAPGVSPTWFYYTVYHFKPTTPSARLEHLDPQRTERVFLNVGGCAEHGLEAKQTPPQAVSWRLKGWEASGREGGPLPQEVWQGAASSSSDHVLEPCLSLKALLRGVGMATPPTLRKEGPEAEGLSEVTWWGLDMKSGLRDS